MLVFTGLSRGTVSPTSQPHGFEITNITGQHYSLDQNQQRIVINFTTALKCGNSPFFVVLGFCSSQNLYDYATPSGLFTHTVEHTHLLQVSGPSSRWLHKAKKGRRGLSQKRQMQVQKHCLEEIYNENSVRRGGRSKTGEDTREKEKKTSI